MTDGLPPTPMLTSPAALLRRLGLRPRKRFSQSFLVDPRLPEQIVRAADVAATDEILEIGPGLGVLTRALAARAARVVAVELDRDLARALPRLVPENVLVVPGDALRLDPGEHFAAGYKLVANLPYQITSPVLFRYLDIRPRPGLLVVMVPQEVAERISARPGRLSYLGVAVQSVAAARILRRVPPGAFFPRPKVDSAVLRLDPLPTPLVPEERRPGFLKLVQAGFAQPRKQLANSLAQGLGVPKGEALALLARAGIPPDRRPQELDLDEWRQLFNTVAPRGDDP
jgi:16S rRNA (adenine1518-N6/adenine1519-N6)-dimethyltransferase